MASPLELEQSVSVKMLLVLPPVVMIRVLAL
jgi:hypothetical protein